MNRNPDVQLVLRDWLADDHDVAPDRVLEVVADRISRQPQRRSWRLQRRLQVTSFNFKIAIGLAAGLIVAVVGWNFLPRQSHVGGPAPTPLPTPSAGASIGAADPLEGRWIAAAANCEDQNAAIQRAGITSEQLTVGGWDAARCIDVRLGSHGSVQEILFVKGGGLRQYADGALSWSGSYEVVDGDTFVASDSGWTLTYQYSIDGDQLVIDMVNDEGPSVPERELWSDIIAQTVIYESGPFTRLP